MSKFRLPISDAECMRDFVERWRTLWRASGADREEIDTYLWRIAGPELQHWCADRYVRAQRRTKGLSGDPDDGEVATAMALGPGGNVGFMTVMNHAFYFAKVGGITEDADEDGLLVMVAKVLVGTMRNEEITLRSVNGPQLPLLELVSA